MDVTLSGSPQTVTADLTPHDAFALDDTASAIVQAPRVIQAVLVTQRNIFLQEALRLRSDIHLDVETPASYRPRSDVDLWIFDGFVPPVLPAQPYWLVGPPADRAIGVGAEVRPGPLTPASAGDPLMEGVDVGNVAVAQSRDLATSTFGRAVIDSQAGPVLLVRDGAPRAALLGFDLHDSDLPLSPAFPVLVERLTEYLAPDAVPPSPVEPDTPVDIPVLGGGSVAIRRPDGTTEILTVAAQAGDAVDDRHRSDRPLHRHDPRLGSSAGRDRAVRGRRARPRALGHRPAVRTHVRPRRRRIAEPERAGRLFSTTCGRGSQSSRSPCSAPSGWCSIVGAELATPLGLLGLLAVPAAVLVWRRFPPPLSPRGSRASLALRCAVLVGISLALSGFALQLPASTQALVVVVDRSASIETALAGEAATVQQLRAGLHADDRFGIVTFGGDAVVEQPAVAAADSAFGGFATQPNANATDIEGALRLAASLLPSDARKHIVILSDGRQNTGDALTEVALLRQAGIRVDVLPVDVPAGPEVLVASLARTHLGAAGAGFVRSCHHQQQRRDLGTGDDHRRRDGCGHTSARHSPQGTPRSTPTWLRYPQACTTSG